MSLQLLSNIPRTREEWLQWAWAHRDSHDRIRAAIKRVYGQTLSDYQIEPINPDAFQDFLQSNSQLHEGMNSVLSLNGSDLQDADLSQDNQLQAWIRLHALEHYYAEAKAGA